MVMILMIRLFCYFLSLCLQYWYKLGLSMNLSEISVIRRKECKTKPTRILYIQIKVYNKTHSKKRDKMDESIPSSPQQHLVTLNEYIQTQFLFYMFPCYYAVIAFIYRYLTLIETNKKYYVKGILMQSVVSSIVESPAGEIEEQLPYKKLTASFLIKYKVSLCNSLLYFIMIVLSFTTSEDLFYGARHKFHSILYLFGCISWYMSAFVIKKQYERDTNQSLWTHRFFWMLTGVFSVTKMFQDYFLPINVIVNVMFLVINVQLLVYGLYRPEDNQTVEMIRTPDIPSFVKMFFSTLQLNAYIRSVFGIEDYSRQSFADSDWYKDELTPQDNIDQDKIKQIQATFTNKKQTAQNIKDQINLMNTLPRRNIFVDKKLRYLKQNDKYKPYYFILSQIGDARFQTQRKQREFVMLDTQMQEIFNVRNFPKCPAPRIIDIVKSAKARLGAGQSTFDDISEEFSSRAQILQQWVQQLVKQPLFMIKPLLQFLQIDQQHSAPFITYFQFSHKSFCSKTYLLSKLTQQKSKQQQIRRSLIGYYQSQASNTQQNVSIKKMIRSKLNFQVSVNYQITEDKEYGFWVVCETMEKGKVKWMLKKYEENILQLNQRIQDQCKLSVSFYYKILSNVTTISHKAKAQAYREYIEKLLQTDKYYCLSLFQFIRFDPVKIQPKLLSTQMSFSRGDLFQEQILNSNPRDSRYFQMWEDKGEFIQVLRIDKMSLESTDIPIQTQYTQPLPSDQHKFIVRRNGTTLRNKRTSQLQKLRQKLYNLYKGINHVPILDLKDCNKQQMKNRIQNFLLKIQSLPKIQINKDYKNFYQNSL